MRRDLIESDGEKCALHLLEKRGAQSVDGAFISKNANIYPRIIGGDEEWEALDVIPMGMGDQDRKFESLFAYLFDQRLAESPNSRTSIQDNDLIANANFHARSVSSVSGGFRARRWNRTAHAPKPDQSRSGDF